MVRVNEVLAEMANTVDRFLGRYSNDPNVDGELWQPVWDSLAAVRERLTSDAWSPSDIITDAERDAIVAEMKREPEAPPPALFALP
jgi:hypothetical protein